MQKLIDFINLVPEFMWDNVFSAINTLICGLIVAFFTSTFLKKKEERTRIAGVIVEKRINSEQEVLHFLERELFKEEINIDNSSKYDCDFDELLKNYDFPVPYHGQMQYARIFTSREKFDKFYHELEDQIVVHKLWLDTKVREHLVLLQLYFDFFNIIPLMIKRIPLPKGKELTDEEFNKVDQCLLLLLGHCCDDEINELMSELDEKVVDSVYKLELTRPKKSLMRDNLLNVDMNRCMKRIQTQTIPGKYTVEIYKFIMDIVYQIKHIDTSKMSDEEYEDFLKSSMPQDYERMQQEKKAYDEMLHEWAEKQGVKIIHKKDLADYPDMYGLSLKEALEGKKPIKNRNRKVQEEGRNEHNGRERF